MSKLRLTKKLDKLMDRKIPVPNLWDDGNAFAILAKCRRASTRRQWTDVEWEDFSRKAKEKDFDHLVQVVMSKFEEADDGNES